MYWYVILKVLYSYKENGCQFDFAKNFSSEGKNQNNFAVFVLGKVKTGFCMQPWLFMLITSMVVR